MEGITIERILEYWNNYFPEYDRKTLENQIINFKGKSFLRDLVDSYKNYDTSINTEVNKINFKKNDILIDNEEKIKSNFLFEQYIFPILNSNLEDFLKKLKVYNGFIDYETVCLDILEYSYLMSYNLLYKSVIDYISRLREKGVLEGDTPQNRMKYFKNVFSECNDNIIKFYSEYQTVTNLAYTRVSAVFNYTLKIIEDIHSKHDEINKIFELGYSRIAHIKLGKGDTHQNCKSVATIIYDNSRKIIYKPHTLDVDKSFGEFLTWLHKANAQISAHYIPKIVLGNDFGIEEYIEYKDCSDREAVENFYIRIGELLCLFYSLNSVDIHYENLIAHGEYPVLIDLETLIHPDIQNDVEVNTTSIYLANRKHQNSVATIGLLPIYLKGTEVGGLGVNKPQMSTFKTHYLEENESDNIRVVRDYFIIEPEQNNPMLDGEHVDSSKYLSFIKLGFEKVYRWVIDNKKLYFSKVIEYFSKVKCRLLLRQTLTYGQLLEIATSAEFAKKNFERELILQRIAINSQKLINSNEVINSEYLDLMEGDIPYFSYINGECDIYDSRNRKIEDFEIVPFHVTLQNKINSFNLEDLSIQLNYINSAFITRTNQSDKTGLKYQFYNNKIESKKWLETAESIGELLIDSAIRGKSTDNKLDLSWLSVTMQGFEEDIWVPSVLEHDLYSGNSGIAYFLMYLSKISGKKHFLQFAEASLETSKQFLDSYNSKIIPHLGAFIGVAGDLYSLFELYQFTKDANLETYILNQLKKLKNMIALDSNLDLIGGCSGLLQVLIKLESHPVFNTCSQRLINKIIDKLLLCAHETKEIIYWNCLPNKHYVGFAHGNAGIVQPLYKSLKLSNPARALELITKSMNYERECLDSDKRDWFRSESEKQYSYGWCHGSPGILLSKLLILKEDKELFTEIFRNDINIALESLLQNGFGNNPTYCHGDLGNLAILRLAARTLELPELEKNSISMFQDLFDRVLSKEWKNKNLKSTNTFGLMVGLSGWGYSMLSNYTNFEIPEFLWLE